MPRPQKANKTEREELDELESQETTRAMQAEDESIEEVGGEEEVREVQTPAASKVSKTAINRADGKRFVFERFVGGVRGKEKTYLKVYLDGVLMPYTGAILNPQSPKSKHTLEVLSSQDPVKSLIPLGINERKGRAVQEVGINGIAFLLPKGAMLSLPSAISEIIEDSFNQTAEAGQDFLIDSDQSKSLALL